MSKTTFNEEDAFYRLIRRFNSLWHGDENAKRLLADIQEEYNAGNLTESQYDKMRRECKEFL